MRRLRQLQEPPHRLRLRRRRPHLQLRQNNAAVKRRIRNKKKDGIPPKKVGLARAISKLGYCSRSRAAQLIAASRVRWNGAVRRDPETPVHLGKDRIEIDSQPVAKSSTIYLALNKPRGVVTTASDEKRRDTVYSF